MSPAIGKLFDFCYRRAGWVWSVLGLLTLIAGLQAAGISLTRLPAPPPVSATPDAPRITFRLPPGVKPKTARAGPEGPPVLWQLPGRWAFVHEGGLRINVSSEGLVPQDTDLYRRYEEVKQAFGSDHVAAVYVQDAQLFTREKLQTLSDLAEKLGNLPAVERTESLFNISTIRSENGGIETGPVLDPLPETQADLDQARALALNNPLMVGTLISADGQATLISLYLKPEYVLKKDFDPDFSRQVEDLLAPIRASGQFKEIFQIGAPVLHVAIGQYMMRDQAVLLPLSCLVLLVLIGAMMGNVQGAFVPLLNAAIANTWALGLMAWLDIPLNMLNYVVPALVVIIGSPPDVHCVVEFRELRARGLDGLAAVRETGRMLGLSLILTSGTTILGFSSTGITDIGVLREFGTTAAAAMVLRFIVTLVAFPAYMRVAGRWIVRVPAEAPAAAPAGQTAASPADAHDGGHESGHHTGWWEEHLSRPFVRFTMARLVNHPRRVIIGLIVLSIPAVWLASHIKLSNDLSSFLRKDAPVMRQLDTVTTRLSGTDIIDVAFRGDPGKFREPGTLQQLFDIEKYLRTFPEVNSVIGLPDFVALVNREFQNQGGAQFAIPKDPSLVHQYLLLFHPSEVSPYVTPNFAQANLVVRCNLHDTSRLNDMVTEITNTLNSGKYGPHVFSITGHAVLAAASVNTIAIGQVQSLGSMILILLAIVGFIFLSWRAAALAVVANLFPIAVVFGIMGLFGISLNLGTCMIADISIGIAVDDTIHLMVRYNANLRRRKTELPALADTLEAEFQPVVLNSLALAGGFLILATSSFVPMQQFGALSALVMFLGIIAEMLITPALLGNTRLITVWEVLDVHLRRALMKASPVLAGFTTWQARRLVAASNLEEHPAAFQLIRAGDEGNRMYVVIEGELEVSRGAGTRRLVLNRLGPGQIIGEVALVARVQRTADVTTLTPVKLLALDWNSLVGLQRFSPYLAARLNLNLARILGLRLADTLGKVDTRSPFNHPPAPEPETPGHPPAP